MASGDATKIVYLGFRLELNSEMHLWHWFHFLNKGADLKLPEEAF